MLTVNGCNCKYSVRLMKLFHADGKAGRYITGSSENYDRYKRFRKTATRWERIYLALILIVSMLLAVNMSVSMIETFLVTMIIEKSTEMDITAQSFRKRLEYAQMTAGVREEFLNTVLRSNAKLELLYLDNGPTELQQETFDALIGPSDRLSFHYYRDNQLQMASSNAGELELSPDEYRQISNGELNTISRGIREYRCYSIPWNEGTVIAIYEDRGWNDEDDIGSILYSEQAPPGRGVIAYRKDTGQVVAATDSRNKEKNIADTDVMRNAIGDEAMYFFELVLKREQYWYQTFELSDEFEVLIYYKLGVLLWESWGKMVLPVLCFLLVSFILIFSGRFGRTIRATVRDRSELIHIRKKLYIDRLLLRRISSLMLFCVIMMTLISTYIMVLNHLSTDNINADTDVAELIQEEKANLVQADKLREYRNGIMVETFGRVIRMIEENETLATQENLETIARIIDVTDITFFDAEGMAEVSSQGYIGYKLGYRENEDQVTTKLFKIIEASEPAQMIQLGSLDGRCYYASKYKTGSGIIRFDFYNDSFSGILDNIVLENVLVESDLGDVDLIYYDSRAPEHILINIAGSDEVKDVENPFENEDLVDGHFKFGWIDGTLYYLNFKPDINMPGSFFITGQWVGMRLTSIISVLFVMVIDYLILYLIHVVTLCICIANEDTISDINGVSNITEEDGNLDVNSLDVDLVIERAKVKLYQRAKEALEHNFAVFLRIMYVGFMMVFVLSFIADALTDSSFNSLTHYLIRNNWEKGFNIFSITYIFLILIALWAASMVIIRLILVISDNMDSAGVTVGRLLISLTRFSALVTGILIILSQLGVKTGTILASAGLTTVVIGIGAQSTVSNILSGLFIIFEGNFRVGDIVLINGWTGMIREIGVRTTCIESYGSPSDFKNIRVINNSDFTDITNLSRNPSQAVILVPVPYEADLEQIDKIFHESAPMMRARLPEMLELPVNDGLLRLDDSAKVMRFRVKCNEADRTYLERRFLQLIVDLLEKNGISIPFNQLVLRQENDLSFILNTHPASAVSGENNQKTETNTTNGKDD